MVFAAKVADVPNFGKKVVQVNGQELLLVNLKGTIYACENECPHQGSPLTGGIVKEGPTISCPRHGYKFNLQTGSCQDFPEYTLRVYPVQLQGDDIMVNLG
jgi:nitrite reductase/ring-hydroxylating ferredoxin subunit